MLKKMLLICFVFLCSYTFAQDSVVKSFIKDWIGKPYRYGGESKKGIDCSAFVQRFYKDVYNVIIPRTCYYISKFESLKNVELYDLKVGDILLFSSRLSPSGWHTGIFIGDDKFIHASNYKEGVKISCFWDSPYLKNLKGIKRL
jgi:cell wall-associated NlpC family hydrolase